MKLRHCLQWVLLFIICHNTRNKSCFSFEAMSPPSGRPPNYSYSDSWTSEDLLPKEKSIIHVKLVRPSPKKVPNWEERHKDNYLLDPSLDFDSPLISKSLNNCLIEYKDINTDIDSDGQWRVQISGDQCVNLPLNSLFNVNNLTHLIIRNTGVIRLTKFLFAAQKLDKLKRIDLIDNYLLEQITDRTFDGLSHLCYLSLIKNRRITSLSIEAFVGLKKFRGIDLDFKRSGNSKHILNTYPIGIGSYITHSNALTHIRTNFK